MKVRFYTGFSKRTNSTKQISSEAYTELDITWKEPTSIERPIAIISGDHFDYTYCYVPSWNRYYFVDDITTIAEDLTQITMSEDYLASWKSSIGSTVAHIAYSSTGWDKDIVDPRIACKTTKTIFGHDCDISYGNDKLFDATGCYILSIINRQGGNNGFVASYVVSSTLLHELANYLMALPYGIDADAIQSAAIKALRKPFDAVISCTWIPVKYSVAITKATLTDIWLGDYNYTANEGGSSAFLLNDGASAFNTLYTVPVNPHYNDFRAIQPYTTYSLYIPNYGNIDINAADERNPIDQGGLPLMLAIDLASGDMCIRLYQGTDCVIQTINCNIGVSCPIAQTSGNMIGGLTSLGGVVASGIGMMGGIATGGAATVATVATSAVGVLTSSANAVMSANSRSTSMKGSINGRAFVTQGVNMKLTEFCIDTEDPDDANYIAKFGRPVGKTQAISNHSGYVQCEAASVTIAGLSSERDTINGLLNSGFYYE